MLTSNNPTITFQVSLDEANKIFKALGSLPFADVYELIGKLNDQANSQLSAQIPNQIKAERSRLSE
jgi:hypothetical protein